MQPAATAGPRGPWIATRTGRYYLFCPSSRDIDIETIAHALSNQCRWSGQAAFYSVAQHSVFVSEHVPPEDALAGLLHDAAEAYVRDVPTPLKHDPAMARFCEVEELGMRVISERFRLPWPLPESVHIADQRACATEWRDILPPVMAAQWVPVAQPFNARITPWPPEEARRRFLARFTDLFPAVPAAAVSA